ncbi:hypothetical protein [Roseateles sp. BYS96W]|uniref:DUF4145 domain-containing protein n=1 Tax=Pelomonas nitida TaxID=3299027 RepID=A0ABW7GB40_9BURK
MADYVQLTQEQRRRRYDDMCAEALQRTEQRLGLPERYVLQLRENGSDWEFLIKLAVLVEAAVTQALVSSLHNELMFDHVSGLSQSARLNLCEKLGILKKDERLILAKLAHVRNQFAHRVENLSKSLQEYVDGLTPYQKVELSNHLLTLEGDDRHKEADDFSWLGKAFRRILLDAVILPLAALSTKDAQAEMERERREFFERRREAGGTQTLASLFQLHPEGWQGLNDTREVETRHGFMCMKGEPPAKK